VVKARGGEGQVVLLSGKRVSANHGSAALLERLTGEPHTRLRWLLAAAHEASDYRPDGTCRGLVHNVSKRSSTNLMRCWRRPQPPSRTPLSLPVLSLPNDGRYPALDPDPATAAKKH
jgi:hypothetical protein